MPGFSFAPQRRLVIKVGSSLLVDAEGRVDRHLLAGLADDVAMLIEVQQAGLFMIKGLTEQQFGQAVNVMAPMTVFAYLREAIDSLVLKGSFPARMLAPVNFDAIYEHTLQQRKAAQH